MDIAGSEHTSQYTQFIFDACIQNCVVIGQHKHGCCVMQRCLEKGTRVQKMQLADFIIQSIAYLIEDPFGNYLVQNVLKLEDEGKNTSILNYIAQDFLRLSQLKFSSNVIEKCLNSKFMGDSEEQTAIDRIFMGTYVVDDRQLIFELGSAPWRLRDIKQRIPFIV